MRTTVPPLPWEILAYILTFLPQRYLLPVILTCHALRNLGEPLLYAHISLSNCPKRCLYLFRTLLSREELCKHVLTFYPADTIAGPKKPLDELSNAHSGQAYLKHTAQVVGRLLQVENISIPPSTPISLGIASLSRIKKFRSPGRYPGIQELGGFLDVLSGVTHLELSFDWRRSQEQLQQIQPHHARCLEGLLCPPPIATILVPLRPIKQLFLVWHWSSAELRTPSPLRGSSNFRWMEALAQSTEVIKSLGLFFGRKMNVKIVLTHVFTATAKFLPDVEELTIWVRFGRDNSHGLKRSLRALSESLSSFRKLRALDFNGSYGWGVPYFDPRRNAISTVYTRILQNWSERCPTLEKVTFPNGMVWIKEPVPIRSKFSKYWPLSFLRTTSPSVPRQQINAMPQGVEDAPSLDFIPGDTPGSDSIFTQGDVLGHTSNIGITTTASLSSPKPAAHTNLNQTTSMVGYRWRCLNQYFPRSDRALQPSLIRIQRSELGWGEPMFKRDLKRGWPEGLPKEISG